MFHRNLIEWLEVEKFKTNNWLKCLKQKSAYYRDKRQFYTALTGVGYNRDFFQNMASENSREALGVRNAFTYVDIDLFNN